MSSEADAIMALQAARHPKLARLARMLAQHPRGITVTEASQILDAAIDDAGISRLDIELIGANVAVPFAPTVQATAVDQYRDAVTANVQRILGAHR